MAKRTPEQLIQAKCLSLAKSLIKDAPDENDRDLAASLVGRAFIGNDPVLQARGTYDWLSKQKQYSSDEAWRLSGMADLVPAG